MPFLSDDRLDLAALIARVQAPDRGAVTSFLGVVRDHQGGRPVARLEYSAYPSMAEAECARIVAEAHARWPARVALAHRVGALEIGDAAVVVAAAAAHRDEAFAACRYVIEEVKQRVPIWKKEFYADGAVWLEGPGREAEELATPTS